MTVDPTNYDHEAAKTKLGITASELGAYMKNLQQTPSIYEYLVTNGWSPEAIPQWVARPRAVLQLEQAQARKKQEAPDEEQPGAGKGRLEAGGTMEGTGETLPIEGVPGGRVQTGPQQPQVGLPAVNRYVDMSTEELAALGLVRTANNHYYRIEELPGGRVIRDPAGGPEPEAMRSGLGDANSNISQSAVRRNQSTY